MLQEGVQRGAYLFQRLRQLQECPPENPDLARVRGIHPVDRVAVGLKPCRHLSKQRHAHRPFIRVHFLPFCDARVQIVRHSSDNLMLLAFIVHILN